MFENVPGPSPWYLGPNTTTVEGFRWQSAGDKSPAAGKTLLIGSKGPVAVLDFQNYAMMLDRSMLVIWNQAPRIGTGHTAPVRIYVVEPVLLSPIGNRLDSLYQEMQHKGIRLLLGGPAQAEIGLDTVNADDAIEIMFPAQLQKIDELLILCHSSAITGTGQAGWDRGDLALLAAWPQQSRFRLYPQDWFNAGSWDYGYQWVTRVARNHETGRIHGEGIRIAPFVLDESLRQIDPTTRP